LLDIKSGESKYFLNIGWSLDQFKNQLLKDINYSLGIFKNNKLEGFIIGDIISVENIKEYEILLIYVNKQKRNLGNATKLLKNIPLIFNEKQLKKIYLEVAENNLGAIKFYKKNGFKRLGMRKNYYNLQNEIKIDAFFFEKKINE